jgi:mycoredoxin
MKFLRITVFLLAAMGLGLGAGYLFSSSRLADPPSPMVRAGDYAPIQSRLKSRVVLYATATCPYCAQARQLLDAKKVGYVELAVDASADAAAEARSLGAHAVPFILIGSNSIEGFDEERIVQLLEQQALL